MSRVVFRSRFASALPYSAVCDRKKIYIVHHRQKEPSWPWRPVAAMLLWQQTTTKQLPKSPSMSFKPRSYKFAFVQRFFYFFFCVIWLGVLHPLPLPLPRQCFTDFTTRFTLLLSQPTSLQLHSLLPLFKWLNYPHPNKWARAPRKELRSERMPS